MLIFNLFFGCINGAYFVIYPRSQWNINCEGSIQRRKNKNTPNVKCIRINEVNNFYLNNQKSRVPDMFFKLHSFRNINS